MSTIEDDSESQLSGVYQDALWNGQQYILISEVQGFLRPGVHLSSNAHAVSGMQILCNLFFNTF